MTKTASQLDSLPTELKRLVVSVLPDLASLRALVHASPSFHAIYRRERGRWLGDLLARELSLPVVVDLVGCVLADRARSNRLAELSSSSSSSSPPSDHARRTAVMLAGFIPEYEHVRRLAGLAAVGGLTLTNASSPGVSGVREENEHADNDDHADDDEHADGREGYRKHGLDLIQQHLSEPLSEAELVQMVRRYRSAKAFSASVLQGGCMPTTAATSMVSPARTRGDEVAVLRTFFRLEMFMTIFFTHRRTGSAQEAAANEPRSYFNSVANEVFCFLDLFQRVERRYRLLLFWKASFGSSRFFADPMKQATVVLMKISLVDEPMMMTMVVRENQSRSISQGSSQDKQLSHFFNLATVFQHRWHQDCFEQL